MSAIAVVRVSGPSSRDVFYKIGKRKKLPQERRATLCRLKDPETNEVLDKALALWFPSPNSFTGEDLCELHIHGGIAVVKSVLNALQKLPNFRLAEPGEFTKRAFMADKLDLTEVEGLADLLHAETEAQQKQALRQMEGALHKLYGDWTERVKKCLATLEAYIDFSEDQHLDESILDTVKRNVVALCSEISTHVQDKRKGEKLRNGVFTVLVGRPNVGKSSLLNIICRRDVAIVSPTAGTTRDIIESSLNLGGYLVNVCDTAGIRESCNSIEQEGVKRAKQRSSNADMLIFILEAKRALDLIHSSKLTGRQLMKYLITEELGEPFFQELQLPLSTSDDVTSAINNNSSTNANVSSPILNSLKTNENSSRTENDNFILLLNKIDLLSNTDLERVNQLESSVSNVCAVSCIDGFGIDKFVDALAKNIKNICSGHRGEEPTITQARHRHHLQNCLGHLTSYEDSLKLDTGIAADNLRSAKNDPRKIIGKTRIEDTFGCVAQGPFLRK